MKIQDLEQNRALDSQAMKKVEGGCYLLWDRGFKATFKKRRPAKCAYNKANRR